MNDIEQKLSVEALDVIEAYKEELAKLKHTNIVMQLQIRKAGDTIIQMEEKAERMEEELETLRTIQMRVQAEAEAKEAEAEDIDEALSLGSKKYTLEEE